MKRMLASIVLFAWTATAFAANPLVEMRTSHGTIVLELYADKAPKSAANFIDYVKSGHFEGTVFHRVINGFMIQGGGFDASMQQKTTRGPIENEAKNGLKNEAGTLAMARTSSPHSATAQFFINLVDNRFLDYPGSDGWGYAVFGRVSQGFDVVQKIAQVPTQTVGPYQDVPVQPVTIESVRVIDPTPSEKTNN